MKNCILVIILLHYCSASFLSGSIFAINTDNTKSKYIQQLLRSAVLSPPSSSINRRSQNDLLRKSHRRLDDTSNNIFEESEDREETFRTNISSYSIQFNKCGTMPITTSLDATTGDNTLTLNSTSSGTISNDMYVLFRLCPTESDDCSSSCTESNNYGEYMISVQHYVEATTEFFKSYHSSMCAECQQQCLSSSEDIVIEQERHSSGGYYRRQLGKNRFYNVVPNCTTCMDVCDQVHTIESNEYIDATNYMQCQKVDSTDDAVLYTGPVCTDSGTKISIGLYTDEYCTTSNLDPTKDVNDYIFDNNTTNNTKNSTNSNISYFYLQQSYTNVQCLSCREPVEQNQRNSTTEDLDTVNEICESLHTMVTKKCEGSNFLARTTNYTNDKDKNDDDCAYLDFIHQTELELLSPSRSPSTELSDNDITDPTVSPIQQEEGSQVIIPILRISNSAARQQLLLPAIQMGLFIVSINILFV